jgi:hypothetical protein
VRITGQLHSGFDEKMLMWSKKGYVTLLNQKKIKRPWDSQGLLGSAYACL